MCTIVLGDTKCLVRHTQKKKKKIAADGFNGVFPFHMSREFYIKKAHRFTWNLASVKLLGDRKVINTVKFCFGGIQINNLLTKPFTSLINFNLLYWIELLSKKGINVCVTRIETKLIILFRFLWIFKTIAYHPQINAKQKKKKKKKGWH